MISAEILRIRRYWITWVLLAAWILILSLQIRAKVNRLDELELWLADLPPVAEMNPVEQIQTQLDMQEAEELRVGLHYPAFIGFSLRLSMVVGWFLVIIFAAVLGGEDFSRRTLRSVLARGVQRSAFLIARILAIWAAVGLALILVLIIASVIGIFVHKQVADGPIALANFWNSLFVLPRVWLSCLPFITVTLFWTVLARQAGPALGVNIAILAFERLTVLFVPAVLIPLSSIRNSGGEIPSPLRLFEIQSRLLSASLGYNAEVFVRWGSLFVHQISEATILPDSPWRAAAFLVGFTILSMTGAIWILLQRDIAYAS